MRLLGLELGEHEIRVARGERAFGTVRLTGVERIPYDGAAELAERLAALAAPSTTVLTALPATAVTHRLLVLPFRDPRRLARTVRLELFGQLPDEPEDALVAYESLGRVTEGSAVLAVVARQADIAAHRALLGPAGPSPPASSRVPPGARRSISCWPGVRARGRRRFAGASPSRWPPSSSVPSTWGSSTTGSRSAMLPSPRRSASRLGPRSRADGSSLRGPSSRLPSPQPATGRRGAARAPSASSATSARACPRRSRSTSTSWWSSPRASGSTGGRTASGRSTRSARLSPALPC